MVSILELKTKIFRKTETNNLFFSKNSIFEKSKIDKMENQENKKVLAGILALVFGYLGVHKFILGYTKEGIIQIVITLVSCGLAGIIPFVEGIIYLTKSDEEFYNTYQVGRKGWF